MANSTSLAQPQPQPQPHFSPAVDTGMLVFVSGQLPFSEDGHITGDIREQTLQCLRNVERILSTLGLSPTDIVKATIWLRHEADFSAFNETYARYFGNHRPARSTVISALARPEASVEIEAIASRTPAADHTPR